MGLMCLAKTLATADSKADGSQVLGLTLAKENHSSKAVLYLVVLLTSWLSAG